MQNSKIVFYAYFCGETNICLTIKDKKNYLDSKFNIFLQFFKKIYKKFSLINKFVRKQSNYYNKLSKITFFY